MRSVHTNHGPGGSTIEVVRDGRGNDTVRVTAYTVITPDEAYRLARLLDGMAYSAAAHNAGAIT